MSVLLLITIFIVAIILTFVFLCIYLKLLSVIAQKLQYRFHKEGKARSNARQDSRIEVCCIYCFDKAYHILYTYWGLVCSAIKYLIWNKPIGENSYDSQKQCNDKDFDANSKGYLPATPHKQIIAGTKKGKQPNANKTIYYESIQALDSQRLKV